MSKINTSTSDLVANITGAKKSEKVEEEKQTANFPQEKTDAFTYKGKKRMRKVERDDDKPLKPISLNVKEETYIRLQKFIMEEKLKGNSGASVSDIGRTLFEEWVDKNCDPL